MIHAWHDDAGIRRRVENYAFARCRQMVALLSWRGGDTRPLRRFPSRSHLQLSKDDMPMAAKTPIAFTRGFSLFDDQNMSALCAVCISFAVRRDGFDERASIYEDFGIFAA